MAKSKFHNLYQRFPELLPTTDIIECGEGLYAIIEELVSTVHLYHDANLGVSSLIPVIFNSIKTKYGVLDIDYYGGDEVIQHLVVYTKKISFKTCEVCGNIGELYCSSKFLHWSYKKTLCKNHAIEYFYYTIR